MNRVKPRTLSGFMELLPEDQMKMERMMQILRETYALFAFTPLEGALAISARDGSGLDELRRTLRASVATRSTVLKRATAISRCGLT